jgi:predicted N-acetyltransferase YhbS
MPSRGAALLGEVRSGLKARSFTVIDRGARYLELVTTLLQRMRLASPEGGIWEAADVQWWYRREQATDRAGQLFWLDGHGAPQAAFIATDFGNSVQCDVLVPPAGPGYEREVWRAAIGRVDDVGARAEFTVRLDNAVAIAELATAGYGRAGDAEIVSCWLEAARRPQIPPLARGYRVLSRADAADRPHPMIARNGPDVARRLNECSLYRPELDLVVEAPDGNVAGYGLFWADPVTRVGLVEPIRTEQAHQGRGIASHLVAAGLDRLAAHGCLRLKVCSDRDLYQRVGFRPQRTATAGIYTRSRATEDA